MKSGHLRVDQTPEAAKIGSLYAGYSVPMSEYDFVAVPFIQVGTGPLLIIGCHHDLVRMGVWPAKKEIFGGVFVGH